MITKQTFEIISICVVSALLIIFAALYFVGTKKRKNLAAAPGGSGHETEFGELAEQLGIMAAQLGLMYELSPVFIVCYDYRRCCFYISENGMMQLGLPPGGGGESDQQKFESLIHVEDISLYEEVTNFEDIRKHEIAESPYIIKIKNATGQYGNYLMRVKPIYDEDGINKALVAAFVDTDYIERK